MRMPRLRRFLPSWKNLLLALVAGLLLILAFPDFDFWFLAWFALVPLMWAVAREKTSWGAGVLGWIFGVVFFTATCWWLTFPPINYAGFPAPLAYFLLLCVTAVAGVFPGLFAAILATLIRRFGLIGLLGAAPVWVATEFLRYWLTGNAWNGLGYSQAFYGETRQLAAYGGVWLVGFVIVAFSSFLLWSNLALIRAENKRPIYIASGIFWSVVAILLAVLFERPSVVSAPSQTAATVIAIQPNVPMSGLDLGRWRQLRERQADLAQAEIDALPPERRFSVTVILPESPMNFRYSDDPEFQLFIDNFAARNNASILFNSAEPDPASRQDFNSAVMVRPDGSSIQYDKVYLLPFGEAVPWPFENLLTGFVGNFSYGGEYDLFPLGDARAGVMICFESHFSQLSREYVRRGADAIIEMTNDGYQGRTPILRQHLANAVFRAVETNRPLLRVTNVGVTAYIDQRGNVLDPPPVYAEAARVWSLDKSDGAQTVYVRYGDWFAWLCSAVTAGLLVFGLATKRRNIAVGARFV